MVRITNWKGINYAQSSSYFFRETPHLYYCRFATLKTTPINTPAILSGRASTRAGGIKSIQPNLCQLNTRTAIKTGCLINQEHPFIGARANSISSCECQRKRVAEVKCPYMHRSSIYHKSSWQT